MAVTTLQPGAVTLATDDPVLFAPHTQSAVVGSPPQWADASDATYATVNRRTHDDGTWSGSDYAVAPLDVFAPSGGVTGITVTVRASSTGTGTAFFRARIYGASGQEGLPSAEAEEMSIVRGGTIQTASGAFLDDDPDPEFNRLGNATAALAEGATLALFALFPFGQSLTVYEVSLTVTTVDVTTVDEVVRVTRQFPRDDAYGLGSAPRLVPPPRGGRLVGGYQ